jgi:hypothetical protein
VVGAPKPAQAPNAAAINSKGGHGGWVEKLECTAWGFARPRCVFRVEAYLRVLGEQEAECSCFAPREEVRKVAAALAEQTSRRGAVAAVPRRHT